MNFFPVSQSKIEFYQHKWEIPFPIITFLFRHKQTLISTAWAKAIQHIMLDLILHSFLGANTRDEKIVPAKLNCTLYQEFEHLKCRGVKSKNLICNFKP